MPGSLSELIHARLNEWSCSTSHGAVELYPRLVRLSFDALCQVLFGELLNEQFFRDFTALMKGADFQSQTGLISPAPAFWIAWYRWHNALTQRVQHIQKTPLLNQATPESALSRVCQTTTPLTTKLLVAEIATLFANGVYPMATALLSLIYTFNKYPKAAEDLHAEAHLTAMRETDLSTEGDRLKSLNQFIEETLRLYPPIAVIARTVKPGRSLQLNGHLINSNTQILLCSWAMQRHPLYWDNPLRFVPSRFATSPEVNSYFPFGFGHQHCIGKQLASTLLRFLTWHLCHGTQISLNAHRPLLMRQSAGCLQPAQQWLAQVTRTSKASRSRDTESSATTEDRRPTTRQKSILETTAAHHAYSPTKKHEVRQNKKGKFTEEEGLPL